ncbi:MAG TPA: adenylate/guanylate cyclase domain-containing protein [Verrucomicrobiae bacterium]|jgi:adenylate cyclase|nr:adenylate/guanylate cyclase domain-containing protein [Verrucomicrobiae bacterium]
MAAPSGAWWQRRGLFGLYELLQSWWRHRVSFAISLGITLAALTVYYFTFLGERPTPIFVFLQRLEFDSLDTRFRSRPADKTPADPRIAIVDIDQRSQEVLGKWPFSRTHFAKMLDVLREDGAKVVAFDITFDKPDQTVELMRKIWRDLEARKKNGEPIDPKYESWLRQLVAENDADAQFAKSIDRFGPVVLGSFFLKKEESTGIDNATLDQYADLIDWYSITKTAMNPATGKQDFVELVRKYDQEENLFSATVANIPSLANPENPEKASIGFFNISADQDGVLRRTLLVLPFGRSKDVNDWQMFGSLEVQAVRLYLGLPTTQLSVDFNQIGVASINFGDELKIKPDYTGHMQINYRGPRGRYLYKSIADVVTRNFVPGTFKGKIVLVGASATGIGDQRSTPYGGIDYPGVEVHANVIDNILHQDFLVRGAKQALLDILAILFLGIPLGIWMALVQPRWMWFGAGLLVPLAAADYLAFRHGWWLNFTVPAMTLVGNVVLVSLYRVLVEEKEKRKVRAEFANYLSPEVIRRLLVDPRLVDPKKTDITVMFSDIRGFTTISEKLDAQELALFLNQYLSDMTRIVFKNNGTLDKYIGDAVMAFWGAPYEEPGHATKACKAALEMMKRVRELQKVWEAEGKPSLEIGIGLNTGVASVGRMGSALRRGYTALGDAVNLSSRLEGSNKDYGTHIIVNETTYEGAKDDGFVFRELDLIRVKGKLQPVTIYQLMGRQADLAADGRAEEVRLQVEQFARARELFRNRQWDAAQRAFQEFLDRWPEDGPSRVYWKRCQEYLFDEPSANWDGVFVMTHK